MRCAVIGADSFVGAALMMRLRMEGREVVGTTRRPGSIDRVFLDLADFAVPTLSSEPHLAFFCAGITTFKVCEDSPDVARVVNVRSPSRIAGWIVARGGRAVMLSSSGAESHPETAYGRLKLECERNFLALAGSAAVFRFGPVVKPNRDCYPDLDYRPIGVDDLCSKLAALCDRWAPGLHRITGGACNDRRDVVETASP